MKQKAISLNPMASRLSWNKIAIEAIVAMLVILWIYVGISKLIEFYNFRYQLAKWTFFRPYAVFISYAVPITELLIAVLLVPRRSRLLGLWASFLLMVIFTVYVALILSFAKELPCTCGGVISRLNWPQHLILNIFLTLISLTGILLIKKQLKSAK